MKLGHGYRVTGRKGSPFSGRMSRCLCPGAPCCWWPREQTGLQEAEEKRKQPCLLVLPATLHSTSYRVRCLDAPKNPSWAPVRAAMVRPSRDWRAVSGGGVGFTLPLCHHGKRHHLHGDKEAPWGLLHDLPSLPGFQILHTAHASSSLFPTNCPDMSWKQSDFPSLSSLPAAGEVKSSSAPSFL